MSFVKLMAYLLKDYDKYTTILIDEMPVFNIVECLKTKKDLEKNVYY
jgi:hypothetical protein